MESDLLWSTDDYEDKIDTNPAIILSVLHKDKDGGGLESNQSNQVHIHSPSDMKPYGQFHSLDSAGSAFEVADDALDSPTRTTITDVLRAASNKEDGGLAYNQAYLDSNPSDMKSYDPSHSDDDSHTSVEVAVDEMVVDDLDSPTTSITEVLRASSKEHDSKHDDVDAAGSDSAVNISNSKAKPSPEVFF